MSKRNMYEQPSLPEGYYFFVSKHRRAGYVEVDLYRKRFLFDKHIVGSVCHADRNSIAVCMNSLKNSMEDINKLDSFCGFYPPKKLGDM